MFELGLIQQLGHPDTCRYMEPAGPADIIVSVTVRKEVYRKMTIAYMWWGRVVVCRIVVIGCVDVSWIMRFTLHNHRLGEALSIDALLVITSHLRVLKSETHK